LHLSGG
jgi:heme/copper-type cytochrome/quinol oxidase subunit 1